MPPKKAAKKGAANKGKSSTESMSNPAYVVLTLFNCKKQRQPRKKPQRRLRLLRPPLNPPLMPSQPRKPQRRLHLPHPRRSPRQLLLLRQLNKPRSQSLKLCKPINHQT